MFVLDASVVANWCFPNEFHPTAEAAFRLIARETALVPALLWFELRNVLLIGERRNRLSESQTARFLRYVGELPIEVDRDPDDSFVLGLARTHRLSVYDAVYLELAQRKALPLATLDGALIKAAGAERVPLVG
jgi:predicted nucleic acid-binding protein